MMAHLNPRLPLIAVVLIGACSSNTRRMTTDPTPVAAEPNQPETADRSRLILARGYQATASVTRVDSVILSLPDGTEQVQVLGRSMKLDISIAADGEVEVRLDSLAINPSRRQPTNAPIGVVWRGQLTRDGLVEVEVDRDDPLTGDLTNSVRELFPAVPRGGADPGESWVDTTTSERQVEIFKTADQRRSLWTAGARTRRGGIEVMPVSVAEEYEQQGSGDQSGREMRMSAQGSRSATYYLTVGGRIDAIEQVDRAERLITIPSTRQAVPTRQIVRTTVQVRN